MKTLANSESHYLNLAMFISMMHLVQLTEHIGN